MMRISGRITSCCVALFLILTSVSAVHKRLNSIKDLKDIDFGVSVPTHSLVLLHWFANAIDISNTNVIYLAFALNRGDYGSHHYGNYDGLLGPLPSGYQYYTIGNLYQDTPIRLPDHVVNPPTGSMGGNRARIIIRINNTGWGNLQRIDQVYITQHYSYQEHQGGPYDPEHTYEITTNLLRQIREFSVRENNQLVVLRNIYGRDINDSQLNLIINSWGDLACLGLLLSIVFRQMYHSNQSKPTNYRSNLQSSWNSDPSTYTYYSQPKGESQGSSCLMVCFGVFVAFLVCIILLFVSLQNGRFR